MMAEYIEREKVYKMLHTIGGCGAEPDSWADGWDKAIDTAIRELEDLPVADVAPVRHGEWLQTDIFKCSECGYSFEHEGYTAYFNYCPNCSAKMDGKGGEQE